MSKKKKIIIISVMAVLLVVTGYLNIALNNKTTETSGEITTTASFFDTYKEDRTSTREQEILYLDAIIASESSSSEAKLNAEKDKSVIVKAMETELNIEGLVKAKGFNDCIVTSTTSNMNVIVKSAELNDVEVASIVDIIQTETGLDIDNIKIIPVE